MRHSCPLDDYRCVRHKRCCTEWTVCDIKVPREPFESKRSICSLIALAVHWCHTLTILSRATYSRTRLIFRWKTVIRCRLHNHACLRALKKKPGWIVASRVINVEGRRSTYTRDISQPDMMWRTKAVEDQLLLRHAFKIRFLLKELKKA